MELKVRNLLEKAFLFLIPVSAAAAGGLKDERAFLVFSLASLAFFVYERETLKPENHWFMYFAWLAFSSFFSQAPVLSFFTAFKWLVFYLFYSYLKAHGGVRAKKIFICSMLSVSFVCAILLFMEYGVSWPYSFGVIGKNRNYTALLLMLSSVYFFYSYFKSSGTPAGLLRLFGAAFFVFPVIMLNSRGVLMILFSSYAAVLLIFGKKRMIFYSLALLVAAVLLLPRSFLDNFLKLDEAGSYMRPYLWKASLKGVLEYPLTGYGPGLFENVFSLFKFRYFDGISYFNHTTLHAHSEALNIAAESGFMGLGLFLFAFYRTMFSKNTGEDSALFKVLALAVFLQGLVDVIFFLPLTGLLFLSFCGFSEHSPSGPPEKAGYPLSRVFLLFSFALIPYFLYLADFKRIHHDGAYDSFSRAFEKNPAGLPVLRRGIVLSSPNSPRIEALSAFAAARHPNEVFFLYEQARCAYLGGDMSGSEKSLRKALYLEPGFKRARLLLAETLLAGGRKGEASKNLEIFSNVVPSRPVRKEEDFYNLYLLDFDPNIYKNLRKRLGARHGPV